MSLKFPACFADNCAGLPLVESGLVVEVVVVVGCGGGGGGRASASLVAPLVRDLRVPVRGREPSLATIPCPPREFASGSAS